MNCKDLNIKPCEQCKYNQEYASSPQFYCLVELFSHRIKTNGLKDTLISMIKHPKELHYMMYAVDEEDMDTFEKLLALI